MSVFLSEGVKVTQAITTAAGASGTGTITGATLDMQGYEGVMILVAMGPIASSGPVTLKVQQDTDSAMGAAADLEGTGITVADDADNTSFIIDIRRPRERYVRLIAARHTSNASTVGAAYYLQYDARNRPVTQSSGITTRETWIAVAEGTA